MCRDSSLPGSGPRIPATDSEALCDPSGQAPGTVSGLYISPQLSQVEPEMHNISHQLANALLPNAAVSFTSFHHPTLHYTQITCWSSLPQRPVRDMNNTLKFEVEEVLSNLPLTVQYRR